MNTFQQTAIPDNVLSHSLIAISTFALTNSDDLLLLSIYFSRPDIKRMNIVLGQYTGILALIILSLTGILLNNLLPEQWIGLLGLIPLFLGLRALFRLWQPSDMENTGSPASTGILNIAAVTIANGGDNVGVYTPLFASLPAALTFIYVLVFILMTGAWCALSFYLVKHPWVKKLFAGCGHWLLPFFLVFLGGYILLSSGSLSLLTRFLEFK